MKTYLERQELELLEQMPTNLRDRLLIRLLVRLGCRISEALALTVQDIDSREGTVTIQHLKAGLKLACPRCSARLGRSHSFCPKCGERVDKAVTKATEHRRVRTLPVDRQTMDMLRDYIACSGFLTEKGRTFIFGINRHRAWQIVRDCARRACLGDLINPETGNRRGVSPHRLRDAFAVHAAKQDDSGDGLRLLQEHLGHASFNTTAKYRKVAGKEHREWYERLWRGAG
ncbi:MAG: integrase [Chloroflexi bacterium]|nr:integrase [Chloroflexota bacterium]